LIFKLEAGIDICVDLGEPFEADVDIDDTPSSA
jgi:hypothetical protein